MIEVPDQFHEKCLASVRDFKAKVIIDYTDWEIDSSIEAESDQTNYADYSDQVADGIEEPTARWFSLQDNDLSGDYKAMPYGEDEEYLNQVGWWSDSKSDGNGDFATSPVLTVSHVPRPVRSMKVVGYEVDGIVEYPVDFEIRLYEGGDLVHTETVTGNDSVKWSLEGIEHLGVTSQELEISKWSEGGRCAKVLEFFTSIQETYYDDMIHEIRLLEERDVKDGAVPVGAISSNEVEVVLDNADRRFDEGNEASRLRDLLRPNRRIRPYIGLELDGGTEWVPLGTFFASQWNVRQDQLTASVVGRDMMERLSSSYYTTSKVRGEKGEEGEPVSLYDLADDVLTDYLQYKEYESIITEDLQGYHVLNGYFETMSHREALKKIAGAGSATAYISRHNDIVIENIQKAYDEFTITDDHIFEIDIPHKPDEVANIVEVKTNPLKFTDNRIVYESQEGFYLEPYETRELMCHYDKVPVTNQQSATKKGTGAQSVDIIDQVDYCWGSILTVENTSGNNVGPIRFEIKGDTGEVMGRERVRRTDEDSRIFNGDRRFEHEDNHLMQSRDVARDIADLVVGTFADSRRDVEVTWLGDPAVELGDRLTVPTYRGAQPETYVIIRNELEYDGGLRMTTTGRKL